MTVALVREHLRAPLAAALDFAFGDDVLQTMLAAGDQRARQIIAEHGLSDALAREGMHHAALSQDVIRLLVIDEPAAGHPIEWAMMCALVACLSYSAAVTACAHAAPAGKA